MKTINLDNFLDKNLRMIFLCLGIGFAFSFISSLNSFVSFSSSVITILLFIMTASSFVLIKLKKAIVEDNGLLFNAVTFANQIVFYKKIDTDIFVYGNVKRLDKSQGMWLWFGPITGFLREYNGYTIILYNESKSINVSLMSLTDAEMVNDAIEFIQNNSNIVFSKLKYKNHW
jgi:hypothetical protein